MVHSFILSAEGPFAEVPTFPWNTKEKENSVL